MTAENSNKPIARCRWQFSLRLLLLVITLLCAVLTPIGIWMIHRNAVAAIEEMGATVSVSWDGVMPFSCVAPPIRNNIQLDDRLLDHVGGLFQLRALHISDARITDEGMVHVGRLRHLREFYADNTNITSLGGKCLGQHKALMRISLSETEIDD